MTKFWKYKAISRTGNEVCGCLEGEFKDVENKLLSWQMDIVEISFDLRSCWEGFKAFCAIPSLTLAVFFEDMFNMHSTGMSITQIIMAMKQSTRDKNILYALTILESSVAQGSSFAEAVSKIKGLDWIVGITLYAGEKAGQLTQTFQVLSVYFRRKSEMKDKLKDALIYPGIVFCALLGVMIFVGFKVIPQLRPLLPPDALGQGATMGILVLSSFIRQWWLLIILFPLCMAVFCAVWFKSNINAFEEFIYQLPILGHIYKEYNFAVYFLNLSILLKSGLPLLQALNDLNTMGSNKMSRHFLNSREYMYGGMSFWESLKMDNFFPVSISFTIRRGEEIAQLEQYCWQIGDYFNKQVSGKLNQAIVLIQPFLLACAGLFLGLIAFAFLVPIYGSLTKIAGG